MASSSAISAVKASSKYTLNAACTPPSASRTPPKPLPKIPSHTAAPTFILMREWLGGFHLSALWVTCEAYCVIFSASWKSQIKLSMFSCYAQGEAFVFENGSVSVAPDMPERYAEEFHILPRPVEKYFRDKVCILEVEERVKPPPPFATSPKLMSKLTAEGRASNIKRHMKILTFGRSCKFHKIFHVLVCADEADVASFLLAFTRTRYPFRT